MPSVSRRSFVELATGMLASLPVLAGGRILAPRPAFAAQDDATVPSQLAGKESQYVVIDVVEPWEVGCMVVDISKGEARDGGIMYYPPVAGAHVTVTSRFNSKVVEGTTNESGVVNLDIRELSVRENGQDASKLDSYFFNGKIEVERDNYRKFETALMAVEGGGGLQVPAHPLDDKSGPYPYQVTFDEWDALYSVNEFSVTPANTDEHSVVVTAYGLPGTDEATVELWVNGEKKPRASAKATVGEPVEVGSRIERVQTGTERSWVPENRSITEEQAPSHLVESPVYGEVRVPVYGRPVTATFKAPFLKKGDAACLPIHAKMHIAIAQGSTTWKWPLAVTTSEGVVDEPAAKEGQELSPINTQKGGTTGVGATWPSKVPIIGGGDLKFWSPQLPVNVYVNPFGLVQLTLSLPLWGYRNDKGDDTPHGWQRYPHQSVKAQWDRKVKTMKAMADKTSSLVSKPGKIQQIDLFKSFSVDLNLQLLALAQWNAEKGLFQGEVAGQFLASVNFTITENFFAGPIPVLITFALDASFILGLSAAAYAKKKDEKEKMVDAIFDFSRWSFDYTNTGLTITISITPSLSVGVGIRGVASISVKGAITLTLFFGVPMGTQPKGLPSTHFAAGWAASVSLVLELFFFTKSFSLYDKAFENFYDNWKGGSLSAQAGDEALQALADKSIDELLGDLEPITDEMLAETAEASLAAQALSAQGESGHIDWGALAAGGPGQTLSNGMTVSFRQEVVEYADGSSMTFDVFDMRGSADEGEEEQTAPAAEQAPAAAASDQVAEGAAPEQAPTTPDQTSATAMTEESVVAAAVAEEASQSLELAEAHATEVPDQEAQAADADTQAQGASSEDSLEPQSQEPALETQAADDETPDLTWLTAMTSGTLPHPSVSAIGDHGGIRPSSDQLLFGSESQHVLSAAHAKVFDIGAPIGMTAEHGVWCFRIGSVLVGGKPRTRVIANCIEGAPSGTSKVIEFNTGLAVEGMDHDNLYDYDFDVMVREEHWPDGSTVSVVNLVILSGTRDNGGNTALVSAATNLVFSHVRIRSVDFTESSSVLWGIERVGLFSMRASELANRDPDKFHCISNLRICNSPKKDPYSDMAVIFFLDRIADTAEAVLGDQADVCVGAFQVQRYDYKGNNAFEFRRYPADWWHDSVGDLDPTIYEADFTPTAPVKEIGDDVPFILMLRGATRAYYFRTVLEMEVGASYHLTLPERCGDFDSSIRLVWCPGVDGFLASYPKDPAQLDLPADKRDYSQWSLHKIVWPWGSTQLQATPIGPAGFNVLNFACRGNFIFWPQSRDTAEGRIWNNDHTENVQPELGSYQIMGCRTHGGRFSEPFVVADLPTDTDQMAVVSVNAAAVLEALRTEYVDTGARDSEGKPLYHAANIWYTSVPAVRCVTATACDAPNPFVRPGGQITFHVAVRNDGNTFLAGCTFELCVRNETTNLYERVPGATAQVSFGKDTIQESTYNRMGPDGKLTNLEDDYALAPGKTSVYAATVTVPKDWASGERKVLFVASGGVVAKDYALSAQADDEPEAVEFSVEPGSVLAIPQRTQPEQDPEQRHMDVLYVEESVAGGDVYAPAPVSTDGDGTSGGGEVLPKTGDEHVGAGLGLAGVGVAALGAAVAAYERRRAENEGC